MLRVLAVGKSALSANKHNETSITDQYCDILDKSLSQNYLNKRVALYLTCLETEASSCLEAGTIQQTATVHQHELGERNHRLHEEINRMREKMSRIDCDLNIQNEILNKISQIRQLSRQINCLNLGRIASVCIEQIPQLISARFASLYQFDEDKQILRLLRHNHPYTIDRQVVPAEQANSPMAIAVRQGKLLLVKDFCQWPSAEKPSINRLYARNYESNSCIIAPLLSGQRILGILNLADKIEGSCFDPARDLPPVELLCEIIGSAMSNIKLYEEVRERARTDSMTGLVNHRTFYDELDKEVSRSSRYGGNLSLIMVDLDNLKEINDEHGHRAGDAVLLHLARQITCCIRDIDIAARYGGDEFSIVLPNTSVSDALIVARRLRTGVAQEPVQVGNGTVRVSVSIGMGQYRNGTIEEFINDVDHSLLEAKAAGKNCIQVFEPAVN